MQALVNHIIGVGNYLKALSVFINTGTVTKEDIKDYILSSFPSLQKECNIMDSLVEKERQSLNKDKFIHKVKPSFEKAEFDSMGFFIASFDLKSHLLEQHSKMIIYDGEYFEININNFLGKEQVIVGTSAFI